MSRALVCGACVLTVTRSRRHRTCGAPRIGRFCGHGAYGRVSTPSPERGACVRHVGRRRHVAPTRTVRRCRKQWSFEARRIRHLRLGHADKGLSGSGVQAIPAAQRDEQLGPRADLPVPNGRRQRVFRRIERRPDSRRAPSRTNRHRAPPPRAERCGVLVSDLGARRRSPERHPTAKPKRRHRAPRVRLEKAPRNCRASASGRVVLSCREALHPELAARSSVANLLTFHTFSTGMWRPVRSCRTQRVFPAGQPAPTCRQAVRRRG